MPEPLRILVTGSRDWTDRSMIEDAIRDAVAHYGAGRLIVIVHGNARGADALAGLIADQLGFAAEAHPADWARHGRSAGHRRNAEMITAGADVCLAFPLGLSPGTRGCIRLAERAGIPVQVYEATEAVGQAAGIFGPDWTGGLDSVDWVRQQRD